jgi:hypothetical protein
LIVRRWIISSAVVLAGVIAFGELGAFEVGSLDGRTLPNFAWQVSGDREAFIGDVDIAVRCREDNVSCREIATIMGSPMPSAGTAMTVALSVSDPPWCYTPVYKSGELQYDATVDVRSRWGSRAKRIALTGVVSGSTFGLSSCGRLRAFLYFLAVDDIRNQMVEAAKQGETLMWKCADGVLRGGPGVDPCASR